MMKCGLYIRVSTEMQKEKGESLDTQLKRLNAYVDSKEGWSVVETYKDAGVSAKNTNRPEFNRMMGDIEQGKIDVILCTKLDRLFRNTRDFLNTTDDFEKENIKFVCLDGDIDTTTATGRVFSIIRSAFTAFERETTAERVTDVMKSRAEQGKWNGGIAPYGYKSEGKTLKINLQEKKIIEKIYNLYLEYRSILYIVHKLNEDGVRTRKGELWSPTSIRRILTSSFYYGEIVYNKRSHTYKGELKRNPKEKYIKSKGVHPPIITKELFDKVQAIIKQQSKIAPKRNSKYLLTGLVYCAECGTKMYGERSRADYTYYRCCGHTQKGNAKCNGNSIRMATLETSITNDLKNLSINHNRIREVLKEENVLNDKDEVSIEERLKVLQGQLIKVQTKKERIFELFEESSINKAEFLDRKKLIDEEEASISKDMEKLRNKLNSVDIDFYDLDTTLELCKDMKEIYDELDIIDRKELIRNLLAEIKVDKHHFDYAIKIPPKLIISSQDSGLCVNSSDTDRGSWRRPA